jgi:hypothetical protein
MGKAIPWPNANLHDEAIARRFDTARSCRVRPFRDRFYLFSVKISGTIRAFGMSFAGIWHEFAAIRHIPRVEGSGDSKVKSE